MTSEAQQNILSTVAFNLLKDAELIQQENNKLSEETWQALHSFFGNVLVRATELLENGPLIQYQTPNGCRKILKISNRKEQYALFPDLNFCHCRAFNYQVLREKTDLTCKHVLACKLAQIYNLIKIETITDSQFTDLLNYQYEK